MPEHLPEVMPDRMPDSMPEDMSDRMPEDLPVRKCINVMVGNHTKKSNFAKTHFLCSTRGHDNRFSMRRVSAMLILQHNLLAIQQS